MKKVVLIVLCVTIALLIAIGGIFAQMKSNLTGTWAGYAIVDDGSRADFTLILEKGEEGLTGKITDETGMIPEMQVKNAVFKDNKLSFEFEFPSDMDYTLIKIELKLEGDTLKGFWTDPDGDSDIVDLARKK